MFLFAKNTASYKEGPHSERKRYVCTLADVHKVIYGDTTLLKMLRGKCNALLCTELTIFISFTSTIVFPI